MTTAIILAIVVVASIFGIAWSRARTRRHRETIERGRELRRLDERASDLERRVDGGK